MIIHDMEQYSEEWWNARKGIPTASCADKILTPTGKLSTQSRGYINELIADSLGYGDEPREPTDWMIRGLELEPEARAFYEFETNSNVQEVGFITNDDGTAGCSPDGLLIGEVGWEVKCPKASNHIGYLLDGGLPNYYAPQVHFSMAVSGLKHWVFISYFPGLDPLIVGVEWNDYTDKVSAALTEFINTLKATRDRLRLSA